MDRQDADQDLEGVAVRPQHWDCQTLTRAEGETPAHVMGLLATIQAAARSWHCGAAQSHDLGCQRAGHAAVARLQANDLETQAVTAIAVRAAVSDMHPATLLLHIAAMHVAAVVWYVGHAAAQVYAVGQLRQTGRAEQVCASLGRGKVRSSFSASQQQVSVDGQQRPQQQVFVDGQQRPRAYQGQRTADARTTSQHHPPTGGIYCPGLALNVHDAVWHIVRGEGLHEPDLNKV